MDVNRKSLDQAEPRELRDFCRNILNIEAGDRENRDMLLKKIAEAGWTSDSIPVVLSVSAPPTSVGHNNNRLKDFAFKINEPHPDPADPRKVKKSDRIYYSVTIPSVANTPGGEDAVPLSPNGNTIWVPRGVPTFLPEEHLEALQNAVTTQYDMDETHGLINPRAVPAYPYNINPAPSNEEIRRYVDRKTEQKKELQRLKTGKAA